MVSRRLVRVKIMQLMYAQNRGVDFDPKSMQVQLESSLKKTIQLQWVFLNYLVRISEYDLIHHAKQAGKETAENTGTPPLLFIYSFIYGIIDSSTTNIHSFGKLF